MFELIPCAVGALVAALSPTRMRLTARTAIASLAGALVAVVSGEATAWTPALLLDAILAAASCVAVVEARRRFTRTVLNRRAIAAVLPKA
jgi:hypothetical protein